MNQLVIIATFMTLASAAQLPSATYLPQGSGAGSSQSGAGFGLAPGLNNNKFGPNQGSENTRPQQAVEKNAAILKLDQDANEEGFHYSYETSNGIQAEESGNAAQTRGAFAYKGDDGQVYSVTFTAGEDGYRPQGAHLPVPPPTPEEILLALKQNEQDEAAGIFDDGQYHPESNGQGSGKFVQGSSSSSSSSSGAGFGSANHKGTFNSNSGYSY